MGKPNKAVERKLNDGEPVFWVLTLDQGLKIISTNALCCSLAGLSEAQLVGRRMDEVFPLGALGSFMRKGFCFQKQTVVFRLQEFCCNFEPFSFDGKFVGGSLSVRKKQLADRGGLELQDVLRCVDPMVDLGHGGIVIVDQQGIITLVDMALADILGSRPQNMVGRHVLKAYSNSKLSRLPIVMDTGKPEIGDIHNFNGRDMVVSRYPIILEGKTIGAFGKILFQDIQDVIQMANRLQSIKEVAQGSAGGRNLDSICRYDINSIVGGSKVMAELKKTSLLVAERGSNVLLFGESGTGKELFAHAIHAASRRNYGPFVKINCAAIPENLLEAELFGYTDGAFTGAKKGGQRGKFELAHRGTIFLDEIGDMSLVMQSKLLRVLQDKEITPLGCNITKQVDVRVIAATNVELSSRVKRGEFRADLYYRLNIVALSIPPLRARVEDIDYLLMHFLEQFNGEFGLQVQGLEREAMDAIKAYSFPGNIRELRNAIESAFNKVTGEYISKDILPISLQQNSSTFLNRPGDNSRIRGLMTGSGGGSLPNNLREFERRLITDALEQAGGNRQKAARLLGIPRQGLYKRLHKLNTQIS